MSTTTEEVAQPRKSYSEKLRDPRWQKKRLELLESAGWKISGMEMGLW